MTTLRTSCLALSLLAAQAVLAADDAATIPAPAAGSKYEQEINALRDQLALLQAQATVATAKSALDTANGTKSADQKLKDTLDAIKAFGDAMPKGDYTVQSGTTTSPEAMYQNFTALRVAALHFAALLRSSSPSVPANPSSSVAGKTVVFVPFGHEAVGGSHLRDFEQQTAHLDSLWSHFGEEIGEYQKPAKHFWAPDETNAYFTELIKSALEAGKPLATDTAKQLESNKGTSAPDEIQKALPTVPAVIAAAPTIANAIAGLFRSDVTESVGTSGLTDDGLQSAIAEGLLMPAHELKMTAPKSKPSRPQHAAGKIVGEAPSELYLDRDVYLAAQASAEEIETEVEKVAFSAYRAVRIKAYVDEALTRAQKMLDAKTADLTEAKKKVSDDESAIVALSKPADGETADAKAKREAKLPEAQAKRVADQQFVTPLRTDVIDLAQRTARLKSLSDRLNAFNDAVTSFLAKLATNDGSVPVPQLLVREWTAKMYVDRFYQLSVQVLAQGASTVTAKHAFWTTRKGDSAIALAYRLTTADGKILQSGVYAENNYAEMGKLTHASTENYLTP